MLLTHTLRKYTQTMLIALAALGLASCNWMDEDLEECENIVRVHLVYDYNIQRADMFSDHVGEVRLYVIDDATNKVVRDTVVSNKHNDNAIALHPWSQTYYIDFKDLPSDHSYRFVAYALQKPEKETMTQTGDKYHITAPTVGEDITKLNVRLSRSTTPDAEGRYEVNSPKCGLDTLWMTRTEKMQPLFVPAPNGKHQITEGRVEMIRDTKYLSLTLRQIDAPTAINDAQYRVEIVDNNGQLDWDNKVLSDNKLLYTPHAQWTTEILNTSDEVTARAAHYDISFSRLMYKMTDAPTLRIFNVENDRCVADINLASILAQGRNYYEIYNYSPQEYLDREYDYDLDLFLLNNEWQYIDVKINVAAWAIRIQKGLL